MTLQQKLWTIRSSFDQLLDELDAQLEMQKDAKGSEADAGGAARGALAASARELGRAMASGKAEPGGGSPPGTNVPLNHPGRMDLGASPTGTTVILRGRR